MPNLHSSATLHATSATAPAEAVAEVAAKPDRQIFIALDQLAPPASGGSIGRSGNEETWSEAKPAGGRTGSVTAGSGTLTSAPATGRLPNGQLFPTLGLLVRQIALKEVTGSFQKSPSISNALFKGIMATSLKSAKSESIDVTVAVNDN